MKQFANKDFRQSYVDTHTRGFLASQVRALRGGMSQKEFAKKLGTTQSVVSRYENPGYGSVTLNTLLAIAFKLDIALVVRFADYPDFLRVSTLVSEEALTPEEYKDSDFGVLYSDKWSKIDD